MSPFHPNVEVFADMTIRIGIPYSKSRVTVEISPKLERDSAPSDGASQVVIMQRDPAIANLVLEVPFQKSQAFEWLGKKYEANFQNVDFVKEDTQNFLRFELLLTEL